MHCFKDCGSVKKELYQVRLLLKDAPWHWTGPTGSQEIKCLLHVSETKMQLLFRSRLSKLFSNRFQPE